MKVKMESVYMDVIAGTIIFKEGKILMVKEAKKECYSKSSGNIQSGIS